MNKIYCTLKYLTLTAIICISNLTIAQNTNLILHGSDYKPLVVMIYPPQYHESVKEMISNLDATRQEKYHFLLVSDSTNSNKLLAKAINKVFNKVESIEMTKVYLLKIDHEMNTTNFDRLDKTIFADSQYYQLSSPKEKISLESLLNIFDTKRTWQIGLHKIEEKVKRPVFQKNDFRLGFILGFNNQSTFKEDSAYLPESITKCGISLNYRLNPRLSIMAKGMFSLNIPDQSGLQSSLFSQINISKGGTQTINAEMKFHIFLEGSLQANYQFNNTGHLKPFVGLGVNYINFQSSKIKISKSIDIDNLRNNGGAGGLDLGLDPSNGGDLGGLKGNSFEPLVVAGLVYEFSPKFSLMGTLDYNFRKSGSVKGVEVTNGTDNFSINVGLQFRITKKTKYYYDYINQH